MACIKNDYAFIDGTNNEYVVTNQGEVYSYKNGKAKKLSLTPCSKSKYNPQGYLKCTLSMNNQHIYCMVHRLVAKYFVQGEFDGAVVNHKDGDTYNNSCTNLEWVTQKNNLLDANSRNSQTFTKWYYQWRIKGNNGYVSEILNGQKEIKACINNNKLDCCFTSLLKYKRSKEYVLERVTE